MHLTLTIKPFHAAASIEVCPDAACVTTTFSLLANSGIALLSGIVPVLAVVPVLVKFHSTFVIAPLVTFQVVPVLSITVEMQIIL